MLWKCCTQFVSKFGKLSCVHRTGKGQFSFQSQRRTMPKNVQTTVQLPILLKPSLKDFEHYLASTWDKRNCRVDLTFFGIALLWDWNENWSFSVLWQPWMFQICWHIECSTFTPSSFRIWNSSAGIPSPPLALFIVMLPKAHLTSQSSIFGSRWVITPSWLSGSWDLFCTVFLCILATSS